MNFAGAASGAYDDLEADGFGGFAGFDDGPEDEEDEKLLEDLEDKQLRERISNLESENSNIKEQVCDVLWLTLLLFLLLVRFGNLSMAGPGWRTG